MSLHHATIDWSLRDGEDFAAGRYSREHVLTINGVSMPASSSPSVVPLPWSRKDAVDPEAAFVGSLSACHMLWFLHKAREAKLVVEHYRDEAEGLMAKNAEGRIAITRVTLRPDIRFTGRQPSAEELDALHHAAHDDCFIANSVRTEVCVEPAPIPA